MVLAGGTLEVGGGATHVAPQVSCSSCKKAPGKNRNVRKEDMTGQKRQKAHFPATRNGKLHADEPPRGKSVTPRAVPTVFYSREKKCFQLNPWKSPSSFDSSPVSLLQSLRSSAFNPQPNPSSPLSLPRPRRNHSWGGAAL